MWHSHGTWLFQRCFLTIHLLIMVILEFALITRGQYWVIYGSKKSTEIINQQISRSHCSTGQRPIRNCNQSLYIYNSLYIYIFIVYIYIYTIYILYIYTIYIHYIYIIYIHCMNYINYINYIYYIYYISIITIYYIYYIYESTNQWEFGTASPSRRSCSKSSSRAKCRAKSWSWGRRCSRGRPGAAGRGKGKGTALWGSSYPSFWLRI